MEVSNNSRRIIGGEMLTIWESAVTTTDQTIEMEIQYIACPSALGRKPENDSLADWALLLPASKSLLKTLDSFIDVSIYSTSHHCNKA